MALPQTRLELNVDPGSLTLDDNELLYRDNPPTQMREMLEFVHLFRAFLLSHSNWTPAEVGAITMDEIVDVATQFRENLVQSAVPLVNKRRSKRMRATKNKKSRSGSTS